MSSGGSAAEDRWPPVPGQEFREARHRQISDPLEDLGQPGLWVDVVELSRADQRVEGGCALTTAVGAAEEPCLSPEGDAAQCALRGIVRRTDPSILEEPGEGRPALEHVIHGLGDLGMTRQPGAFGAHPGLESADQRADMRLAIGEPVGRDVAVDQALLGEDGIDLADSLKR